MGRSCGRPTANCPKSCLIPLTKVMIPQNPVNKETLMSNPPNPLKDEALGPNSRRRPTVEQFNERGVGRLPAHLGIRFTRADPERIEAELDVLPHIMAPNGFLHAGAVVTLADTCCGYGCVVNLPEGATGFTTIELKSNHLGTAREGKITCQARPAHLGRTTQVWDAVVSHADTGKTIALFRCTQMILVSKG